MAKKRREYQNKLILLHPVKIIVVGAILIIGVILSVSLLQHRTRLDSEAAVPKYQVWFQASNTGKHGGLQPDFLEQFTQPERWVKAREQIDVYQFHIYSLSPERGITDEVLRDKVVPLLNQNNISIALNVLGANWAQCGTRSQIMHDEAAVIDRIKAAGGNVRFLSIQSTYSKDLGDAGHICDPYPDAKRTQDMVRYIRFMKDRYPGIQIGLMDADTAEDRKKFLVNVMQNLRKQGAGLDYYIHDNLGGRIHGQNKSPEDILDTEKFVKQNLHLRYGLIITSGKSAHSNKAFYDLTLKAMKEYVDYGGRPQIYLITSWYNYPTKILPDASATAFTLMKTTNSAGVYLRKHATKPPKKKDNPKKNNPKKK